MDIREAGDDAPFDYVIAGGGLAGGLVALALAARRPGTRVALIEQGARLGGNHTWSFHDGDLPEEARPWVEPLVAHRWDNHRVRFPDGERLLDSGYASITSERFDRVVRARLAQVGFDVRCGDEIVEVGPDRVRTAAGHTLRAAIVLDARGMSPDRAPPGRCGFQRFLGLELDLAADAHPAAPMLMDAAIEQLDGFRFVYVLPLSRRRLLVEDTTYADTPALDRAALRARILDYAREQGWRVAGVNREEVGVLPLPFAHLGRAPAGSPLVIGYRGGWFHPMTGYSLPVAVQVASAVARAADPGDLVRSLRRLWSHHARQARFCRWLVHAMFTAVAPERRWRLLARFYRLPAPTIERFYALRMTWSDRVRLLAGRSSRARPFPRTVQAFKEVS